MIITKKPKGKFKKIIATAIAIGTISISSYVGTQVATLPTDKGQIVSPIPIGVQDLSPSYEVLRVLDGDTFEITYEEKVTKVRLIGVDTPETVKAGTPVQWYGKEASDFTKATLKDKKVRLEFDKGQRDLYGRLLAYVYLPNGDMLNVTLLNRGYAVAKFYSPNYKHKKLFLDVEAKAKEAKIGLWNEEAKKIWEGKN
jgi:micrococcal nuclease